MNIPQIQLSWMMLEAKESLEKTRETLFYSQKRPNDTQDTSLKPADGTKGIKETAAHNEAITRVNPNSTTELAISGNPPTSSATSEVATAMEAVSTTTQLPTSVVEAPSSTVETTATPIELAQAGKTDDVTDVDTHVTQVSISVAESSPGKEASSPHPKPSSSEPDDKAKTPAELVQVANAGEALLDPSPMMTSDVLKEWKCGRCAKPVQGEKTLRRCFRHSCRGMNFQVLSSLRRF